VPLEKQFAVGCKVRYGGTTSVVKWGAIVTVSSAVDHGSEWRLRQTNDCISAKQAVYMYLSVWLSIRIMCSSVSACLQAKRFSGLAL
jgi:hypothetical protein